MEQHAFKNVNNCLNTNIYSYLETSGGQSSNPYLNAVHFLTPVLIKHLLQHTTIVLLHWCLMCAVLLPWPYSTNRYFIYSKHTKTKELLELFLDISLIYSVAPKPYLLQLRCIKRKVIRMTHRES